MKLVDLDSCVVENDKLVCNLKKPKFNQDGETILAGRANITGNDEEFKVEAAPYIDASIGVSLPTFPGGPSITFDVGPSFPWTIFPIPSRWVDRAGQSWLPLPFEGGPEDKFQGIPPVKYVPPEEEFE